MTRHRQPDPVRGEGPVPGFSWLEATPADLGVVLPVLRRLVPGARVVVTVFDAGRMRITEEEREQGWLQVTSGGVSPPLGAETEVPWEQVGEWWVFAKLDAATALPPTESLANLGDWSLRSPADLTAAFDPTWERDVFDWLPPLQERFWELVESHQPIAVAFGTAGDRLILVASRSDLIAATEAHLAERRAAGR